MATKNDITVIEDNDPLLTFTCKQDGTAINLTGATIAFHLKPDVATEEGATGTVSYTTATSAVTILTQSGATLGQCTVQMVAADLATPGTKKYRLDVTQGGKKLTYSYGSVRVLNV